MTKKAAWKRARQPHQIEERRQAVLEAAARLIDQGGLAAAGLSAIARESGLSKANLYRYFESREAILMELLLDELKAWGTHLRGALLTLEPAAASEKIAIAFAESYRGRHRFNLLFSSASGVLEQNISTESIIAFKREVLAVIDDLASALDRLDPEVGRSEWFALLLQHGASAQGMWPYSAPPPAVVAALENEDLAPFRIDFADAMRKNVEMLLEGVRRGLTR
ncbi:MAG: TetR family transcriptional regulator [Verrucomicrobiota bacterium]